MAQNKGRSAPWHATVRFPGDRRMELKGLAAQRGLTMEGALVLAYEQWRDNGGETRPTSFGKRCAKMASLITDDRRRQSLICVLEAMAG